MPPPGALTSAATPAAYASDMRLNEVLGFIGAAAAAPLAPAPTAAPAAPAPAAAPAAAAAIW